MRHSSLRVLSTAALGATLVLAPAQRLRAQASTAPATAPASVTVVEAGAAPRQALRYKLVNGTSETMTMRQKISMNIEMGGMALPSQNLPVTVLTNRFDVTDLTTEGLASVKGEFVDVELDADGAEPMLVEAMRPQMALLKGVTMTYKVSPTGQISKLEFGANAPAAMQSMQSIEQMSVAFPTEAVGVGARWKAARPVTQNGMTIQQDVEYVVRSLSADSVVLDMSITQSAKDQVMDAAAMPAGATAKLRSLAGKGTSTIAIHFNRVQPAVAMKMDVDMAIDLEMGGQVNAMNQSMKMEITSAPATKP